MLLEMNISNFILIENEKIVFSDGFNVLTGETGAGKSMVLGSLQILLGSGASKDMVRLGKEKASISGLFTSTNSINADLSNLGISTDEYVLLSKEISSKGRSISRINGTPVTTAQLKEISSKLLDIHGQMDNREILDNSYQLDILDSFIGKPAFALKQTINENFQEMKVLQKELNDLEVARQNRDEIMESLLFKDRELDSASLKIGEDEQLESELELLEESENIVDSLEFAYNWLANYDNDESALKYLSRISNRISKVSHLSDFLSEIYEKIAEIKILADDLERDISKAMDMFDSNPERMEEIEDRLDLINSIKFKYGGSIEDILRQHEIIGEKLSKLDNIDELLTEKSTELFVLTESTKSLALDLSEMRKTNAIELAKRTEQIISELNMKDAKFNILVSTSDTLRKNGLDDVEFMISTNAGQHLKPLKKTLSGGELARVMLAIKTVESRYDEDVTLVFDEIDSGISGMTADVVGEKIKELSRQSQIICITHLPQIARHGETHFLISKNTENEETKTTIKKLNMDERVEEIARLVGGKTITKQSLEHAKNMLNG